MSKFKVGDRVRILRSDYEGCGLDVGTTHKVASISDTGDVYLEGIGPCNIGDHLFFYEGELESVCGFTIGQTYQTADRGEVTCIALREDGGMFGTMNGSDTAYSWNADGSYRCALPHECPPYRIVFEPVVTRHNHYAETKHGDVMINYIVIDGKPDWTSAKVKPAL